MDPALFQRAKFLFTKALTLPPERRRPWLEELASQDPEAAEEVRRLLQHAPPSTGRFAPMARTAMTEVDPGGAPRFRAGDLVADRYRIVRRLGGGGMGEVFLVRDDLLKEEVALKLWNGQLWGDDRGRFDRLVAEAQLARRIEHPHVCRVFDAGLHRGPLGDEPFLTLEYVPGEDLAARLERDGPLSPAAARKLATELCSALAAIHERDILHRDLKPANVLLDVSGRSRLTDFGIAVDALMNGEVWGQGTPGYLAPEIEDGERPSVASDLYALGVVLQEAAPLAEVDPILTRIVEACLARDPLDRPPSAARLADALAKDDLLEAAVVLGEPPSPAMIADSRSAAVLDFRSAFRIAILLLFSLGSLVWLIPRVESFDRAGLAAPARQLSDRAQAIADKVAPDRGMTSRVWGYSEIEGERLPDIPYPRGLARSGRDVFFWYREATYDLVNWHALDLLANGGRVHMLEPPVASIGTLTLGFDPDGRLFLFHLFPLEIEGAELAPGASEALEPVVSSAEWAPLFESAELDPASLEEAEISTVFPSVADRRVTLQHREPGPRATVELGSLRGRPVLFAILETASDVEELLLARQTLGSQYSLIATPVFVVFVLFFAHRHWRAALGDPWGARRLSTFVFAAGYTAFLLEADPPSDPVDAVLFLAAGLSGPLIQALVVWALYMGCEPWVRRHWPRSLVSWNRLLRGKRTSIRDPAVASHVLFGAAFGVFLTACRLAERAFTALLRGDALPLAARLPEGLPQLRHGLSVILETPFEGVWLALLFAVIMAWSRRLLRRPLPSVTAAILALAFGAVIAAPSPAVAALFYGLFQVAAGCWIAVRYGLLIHITALATAELLLHSPPVFVAGFPWTAPLSLGLLLALVLFCLWNLRQPFLGTDGLKAKRWRTFPAASRERREGK